MGNRKKVAKQGDKAEMWTQERKHRIPFVLRAAKTKQTIAGLFQSNFININISEVGSKIIPMAQLKKNNPPPPPTAAMATQDCRSANRLADSGTASIVSSFTSSSRQD